MVVNYNMVIDFARPAKSNTILVAENDANSRNCRFTLLFDKAPMDMTGVTTATVRGILPSGGIIFGDATIIQDEEGNNINELEYLLPAQVTENAGNVTMTIELVDDLGARITSFEYYIKVRNALYSEDDYIDDDDMAGFRDLFGKMKAALDRIDQMIKQDALPNPFPLRVTVDNVVYEYIGSEMIELLMDKVAYLGDTIGTVEVTEDDSAAAQAARSAASALESAESAGESLEEAEDILQRITNITDNFESQIPTATVEKNGHIVTITITDKDGTTSETVEDGVVGNKWYSGTVFSTNGSNMTGHIGNVDDYYLNPVVGKIYKCVFEGDDTTALWDYVLTISGGSSAAQWGAILGTLADQTDLADALSAKQDNLVFDNIPISNSNNPVKSGGVYSQMAHKIIRTNASGDSSNYIRVPESGTNDLITTSSTVIPICDAKDDGTPYKIKSCVVYSGYVRITPAENISNKNVGIIVINQ